MNILPMPCLRSLLLIAACALCGAANAVACEPFLDILDAQRDRVVLSLSRCDVHATAAWADPWRAQAWQLSAAARQRWRQTLAAEPLHTDLLAARLRARPADPALPAGPLLLRISARLPAPAAWRWDGEHGEIAFAPHPSQAQACGGVGGLMIWDHTLDVAPGSRLRAEVWRVERPGAQQALPTDCIDRWHTDAPATINQQGELQVPADAVDGSLIHVRAELGARTVSGTLRVFEAHRHPLVGRWQQTVAITCDGREQPVAEPIRELIFDAGGEFSVTRQPFEAYKDYWGRYHHDPEHGTITFTPAGGNRIPEALQLSGRVILQGTTLTLEQIQLWPDQAPDTLCGMRFER